MHVNDAINSPAAFFLCVVYLLIATVWDFRYRRIPLWLCLSGIPVMLAVFYTNQTELSMAFLSLCVSIPIIVIALLIPRQIGLMDGIMLLYIGVSFGAEILIVCLCTALFTASITGGILMLVKRTKKENAIPFIPFIFIGLILGGMGW